MMDGYLPHCSSRTAWRWSAVALLWCLLMPCTALAQAPAEPVAPPLVTEADDAVAPTTAPTTAPAAAPTTAAPQTPSQPSAASAANVMDTLDLGTASITGMQELPRVLYIVPWKRAEPNDPAGRPVNSLLDEVLAPVDPTVFERHIRYYDALNGPSE